MVDLLWLSATVDAPPWTAGSVAATVPEVAAISDVFDDLLVRGGDHLVVWGPLSGVLDEARIRSALAEPGDVFHAGLRLGLAGSVPLLDFVCPTWMLHRDPNPDVVATSWRLSLSACVLLSCRSSSAMSTAP